MDTIINACGRSCPEPVLMTKNALKENPQGCVVLVDNTTAMQNVTRYAQNNGYSAACTQEEETYRLTLKKEG